MWVSMTEQAYMLLYSLIIGASLGVLYDVIRITRIIMGVEYGHKTAKMLKTIRLPLLHGRGMAIRGGDSCEAESAVCGTDSPGKQRSVSAFFLNTVIFIQDVLFFIIAGLIVTVFVYHANNGRVRGFAFAGLCGGFFAYYFTAGRFVMLCSEYIVFALKTAAAYLWFFIYTPVVFIVKLIYRQIIQRAARGVWYAVRWLRIRAYTHGEMRRQLRGAGAEFNLFN